MENRDHNSDTPCEGTVGGCTQPPPLCARAFLDAVIDSLTDALFVLEPTPFEGGDLPAIRAVNRAARHLLGHDAGTLSGAPAATVFAEDETVRDLLHTLTRGGTVHDREMPLFHRDGHRVPVRVKASLVTNCEWSGIFESCPQQMSGKAHCADRLVGFVLVATDMSVVHRTERSRDLGYRVSEMVRSAVTMDDLYRSMHELLREFMPADNFAIALPDRSGSREIRFPYVVETGPDANAARKLTRRLAEYAMRRYEPLLVNGDEIQDILGPRSVPPSALPPVQWLGAPLCVGDRKTGLMVVTSYRKGVSFGEEEREVVRFVSGQVANAIERKREGEDRARLSSAVEHAADAIIITGADGTIEYVNPAFEKMSGYPKEEVIGRSPRLLKSGRHSGDFYREIWTQLARGESWTGRLSNQHRNGSIYEVEAAFSAIRDSSGKTVNYVSVQHDVTYEVALEAQLRQSQKMEAVGKLAGGVAHDFNNILSIIMGYSDLVMTHVDEDSLVAMGIGEIREAGMRAGALTRQLLAFSRSQILVPQVLNLNGVIEDMEKMLRRLIGEDIELVTRLDPDLGYVRADPGQVEQVVMNLAVNARDAMPQGGNVTIATETVDLPDGHADSGLEAGEYVQITVTDTGCGMDEEVTARIFEPFFSTKEDGKGTGLGLSTVYGIVKQSEGEITVHSRPNRGTTFRILLPCVDEAIPDDVVIGGPVAEPSGFETVLIVEDEAAVRDLVREMLAVAGYRVLEAKDGVEALELSRDAEHSIDLLLTDVIMPRMGGRELSQRLVENSPDTRVLFMSGYTDTAIANEGVQEPNIAFLQKPFGLSMLTRKVREVLDGPPWRAGVPIG